MRIALVALLAFLVLTVNCEWEPHNITDIELANSEDQIEVRLLSTPLLKWTLGDILGQLGMYHGAFGFVNKRTGFSWSTEYDGLPDMIHAGIPYIIRSENKTELKWENFGGAMIFMPINFTYWTTYSDVVATISGDLYNKFIKEYLANVNSTKPHYGIFNVVNEGKKYIESQDCWDFVWESFDWLYEHGAKFDYSKRVNTSYCQYHVSFEPKEVQFEDPDHKNHILEYYSMIELQLNKMSLTDVIEGLFDIIINKHVYLYVNNSYHLLNLKPPYFNYVYIPQPLPGQTLEKLPPSTFYDFQRKSQISMLELFRKYR